MAGEQGDDDERSHDRDKHVKQRHLEHLAGREEILTRITIDHRPQQRSEHEENSDNTKNNRAVREEKYLDQHENHSENEQRDDFPAGEAGQIMAEEEQRETNRRDDPGPCCAGNLELEIRTEDSAEQQQRRKRSDPKRNLLEASWLDRDDVAFESRFFGEIAIRIN